MRILSEVRCSISKAFSSDYHLLASMFTFDQLACMWKLGHYMLFLLVNVGTQHTAISIGLMGRMKSDITLLIVKCLNQLV